MKPVDSLLLEAKQAILDEQHRRFQSLQQEGRLDEAMQQFQVTLTCASDLLKHSLTLLEDLLAQRRKTEDAQTPPRDDGDHPAV
ncbi:MAG TPA: hypothetical protein VFA38_02220 [Nitrospirales bacterium]|nr:hypothetical protein [Nitrospirales bacterium]